LQASRFHWLYAMPERVRPLFGLALKRKKRMKCVLVGIAIVLAMLVTLDGIAQSPPNIADYDPLATSPSGNAKPSPPLDLGFPDAKRQRELPVRIYLPFDPAASPVVIFSHGLGGSREGSGYLGRHWSARGYTVVFAQHPGSDESVWKNLPMLRRAAAMRKAASAANLRERIADIVAILDQLETWNNAPDHPLAGRMNLKQIAMAGHSFGAVTTQALAGQRYPGFTSLVDPRIKAAIIMSPSGPRTSTISAEQAFRDVATPWLLMTGTRDDSPIGESSPESRLVVFPALPPGNKYELVLEGGEHSAFTDHRLPPGKPQRDPRHWNTILALSTAFLDTYLRDDLSAQKWLTGDQAKAALSPGDRWQLK